MKKKPSKPKTVVDIERSSDAPPDSPRKVFRVFDIRYDTDGHRVPGLPKELFFRVDADIEPSEDLGDYISNHTGWCHFGYNFEEVPDPEAVAAEVKA